MNHVMLDLETFGLAPDAAIVSIGACKFDPVAGDVDRENVFAMNVDLEATPEDLRGSFSPSTIEWWISQGSEAKASILGNKHSMITVLDEFSGWSWGAEFLWSNGPTFDETILRSAFSRFGRVFPISYRGSRCYRTMKWIAVDNNGLVPLTHDDYDLCAHRADHDAVYQALEVCRMVNIS